MARPQARILMRLAYYEAAQEYLRSLPPEHFMESITQSTQRKITVASLDGVTVRRPEVQVFSELLVQYPLPGRDKPGQVVPDNMIVVSAERVKGDGSFDVPFEPAGPLCVMEYVSKSNKRKDYDDNMRKYERELKVKYYLLFAPDAQELSVFQLSATGEYISVKPNAEGRLAIPELELEVALMGKWVRYWHRGELLPITAELTQKLDQAVVRGDQLQEKLDRTQAQLGEAHRRFEQERLARLALEQELARLRSQIPPPAAG